METINPIIKSENLSVIYNLGKSNEFQALKNINIEIYPGEYVVFFGPSGCGKSTLLYCLAGLETTTNGNIFIKNNLISAQKPRQLVNLRRTQMGMIFQAYNLIPTLTVIDNVLLPNILLGGDDKGGNLQKAQSMLERFGIGHLTKRYPRDLSGGQQQRVAIARSLMIWPPILYADEPTGNLDSESAKIVMNFLTELNEKDGRTIVLVTHDPTHLSYAHRVFHVKNGQITRIVTNTSKPQISPAVETNAPDKFEALSQAYPNLSDSQIKAKALAQYLLTSMDEPEIERFETFIRQRFTGEIDENQFKELLDKPFEDGGAGFYKQTAADFAQKVERILTEAEFLRKPATPAASTDDSGKTIELRRFLLDGSSVTLKTADELADLDNFIKMRFERKIDKEKFREYLDLPRKKGGLGLNRKTAKNFSRKLEMALVEYN